MPIPSSLMHLFNVLPATATPLMVGGCVRDWLLGSDINDFDVEIFNISFTYLHKILSKHGRTNAVGKSFGVIKWTPRKGETYDIAIPRKEKKTGIGHRGFEVTHDPQLSPESAAARRDFTINAIMYDPKKQVILDPYHGQKDLKNRKLKHTSNAFSEDPLRVLRGMQFAARFDMSGDDETLELCRSIQDHFKELPRERIWHEWYKWSTQSRKPSKGLQFLKGSGWLKHFIELSALINTPQDPEWHPEGDVWNHTLHCCDALANQPDWLDGAPLDRAVWMFAILLHDIGKSRTTEKVMKHGRMRVVSPGHDKIGANLADDFFDRIQAPKVITERVRPLIMEHMIHISSVSDRMVRRLAKRLEPETIPSLCLIMTADALGRPPKEPKIPESIQALREKAQELEVLSQAPQPILKGGDLIALGMKPGKQIGILLKQIYDLQLEGTIQTRPQAFDWVRSKLETTDSTTL